MTSAGSGGHEAVEKTPSSVHTAPNPKNFLHGGPNGPPFSLVVEVVRKLRFDFVAVGRVRKRRRHEFLVFFHVQITDSVEDVIVEIVLIDVYIAYSITPCQRRRCFQRSRVNLTA